MTDRLDQLLTDPVSGLRYRVRHGQVKGPCLILLHGVGASEAGFIELARQLDPRLTVVLARGPLELGPGQYGWFRVGFTPTGPVIDAAQAEQARVTLLRLIGQLPQAQDIDPARLWIAGFSQGGIMSASVALTAPQQVAGFGILSGRILAEVLPAVQPGAALTGLRAFVSHGVQDPVLGVHFARAARDVLQGLGVPLQYREFDAGHTLTPAMVADFNAWLESQLH
jgi:phospholipase/carboxylesterase